MIFIGRMVDCGKKREYILQCFVKLIYELFIVVKIVILRLTTEFDVSNVKGCMPVKLEMEADCVEVRSVP